MRELGAECQLLRASDLTRPFLVLFLRTNGSKLGQDGVCPKVIGWRCWTNFRHQACIGDTK